MGGDLAQGAWPSDPWRRDRWARSGKRTGRILESRQVDSLWPSRHAAPQSSLTLFRPRRIAGAFDPARAGKAHDLCRIRVGQEATRARPEAELSGGHGDP